MPLKLRKFRGTTEDLRDISTENGYKLFEPIFDPVSAEPVLEVEEPNQPVKGFENETKYVSQHLRQYNEQCEKQRLHVQRLNRPTLPRSMEDVSTVDYSQSPFESSIKNFVYENYNFTRVHETSKKLPIHEYEKEILEKINLYDVVVIEGDTGCGKSTQVPQYILDNAARKQEYASIVVTQPRKMAAIMLASRVSHERNWDKLCSYQVGLDNQTNPDTRITYMTTEILVQKIIHSRSLNEYTHIILDEVHERDSHTDFALLIVKKLLYMMPDPIKVILMSATIDAMKFSRYFAIPYKGYTIPAPIVSISRLKKPDYKIFYYDNIQQSSNYAEAWLPPDEPCVHPTLIKCCISIIKRFDSFELSEEEREAGSTKLSEKREGVLIFLPGLKEIENLVNDLREFKDFMRWEIFPLHSSITKAEQGKVLHPPMPGFRKIIVSTNIAESSLTIHDVSYVIDFCLTKTICCDRETNYTSLKIDWASKASCNQRAGRVGRVAPGRVYRLVSKGFFENLNEYGTPELCRTPLSASVLKVKMLDMGEPQALLALALDPPNLSEIHRTILVLKQVGALSVKKEGMLTAIDGNLTFLGRVASSLPVDVRISKLIVFGYLFGCFKQTITIAAGLSLGNLFCRPFQYELPAHMGKISFAEESHSDCIALLNAYDLWKKAGGFKWSVYKERIWAEKQYLQLDVLYQMSKLIDELTRRLEIHGLTHNTHLTIDNSVQQHLMLKMCIAAAFYPYYFKQNKRNNEDVDKYLMGMDPLSVALLTNLPLKNTSLYEAQLAKLFRPCSHDLYFSFLGNSRALMHLVKCAKPGVKCSEQNANSVILQLALKMKQIPRIRETLKVDLISEIKPKKRINCKDERTIPSAMVPAPHVTGWKIFITHVEDANHFWAANVTNMDSKHNLSVTNIENIIKTELVMCRSLNVEDVANKTYCLAPFTEASTVSYYRARIESVRPCTVKKERSALVFFLDYGNNIEVPIKDLKTLPDELYEIPQLSIECKLSEVQPINPVGLTYSHDWAQAAYEYTIQQLHYSIHECQIYSITNNIVRVKVYIGNNLLNNILVQKKWARVSEESEDSKFNHHLREMHTRIGNPYLESLDERQSSNISRENNEKDQFEITLSEQTQKFRGPYTSLEMSFRGMSPSLSNRSMVIEMNSVNSTALNFDYDNKHSKFIVSSFVSTNNSETVLMTRDTTLMPAIPGLMEFCLLMFAPTIELRLNEDETGYSGALVGLGTENEQIYKNEDMEIAFDFNFTQDDILSINEIRNCLNNCLSDLSDKNNYKMNSYQKKLQETIKMLINQRREYKKAESFKRPYQWNCIPYEKTIVATPEEAAECPPTFALVNHAKLSTTRSETATLLKVKRLYETFADLRCRKVMQRHEVDECCVLCMVHMKTYTELANHMTKPEHVKKENTALGLC